MFCFALTIASLVGQSNSDTSVYNATSLTDREWWTVGKTSVQVPTGPRRKGATTAFRPVEAVETRCLSLSPEGRWDEGTAWVIRHVDGPKAKSSLEAWRGRYDFFGDKVKDDLLVLRIAPTRMFRAELSGDSVGWRLADRSTNEKPRPGITFEIQLENRHVPNDEVALTPSRLFYVGDAGKEVAQYSTEEKLGGLLKYRGDQMLPRSTGFLRNGEILAIRNVTKSAKIRSYVAPPGFSWRGVGAEAKVQQKRWADWRDEVFALKVLTDRELYLPDPGAPRILSLRPGSSPEAGVAWIIQPGNEKSEITVWRGKYRLRKESYAAGILGLRFTIHEQFVGRHDGSQRRWSVKRERAFGNDVQSGAECELYVSDTAAQKRSLDLAWLRSFNVDKDGDEVDAEFSRTPSYFNREACGILATRTNMSQDALKDLPPGLKLRRLDREPK